jgi:chlorobactene glucosyltransferase
MQIEGILITLMDVAAGAFGLFLGFMVLVVISNIILMPKLRDSNYYTGKRLSILVPARNEEQNIENCVLTLVAQDYKDFEIIVLNDNSTDQTGAILERLSKEYSCLKVIKGTPLPKGWLGKNWACMQLAQASSGDYLLFTDADTLHTNTSASASVSLMDSTGAGLLSGIVKQRMDTMGEKLVVPLMLWGMLCFTPVVLMHYMKFSFLTAACGQFMVFNRESYFSVGGHSAVKGRIDEDKEFARVMKQNGFIVIMADATNLISCKMYGGFREAVLGFSKNIFSAFNYRIIPFVFVWLAALACIITPIAYLAIAGSSANPELTSQALILILLSVVIWIAAYWKTRVPYYMTLLYPMSMLIWFYVSMNSMYLALTGKSTWKGRNMPKPKVRFI